MGHHSCCNKQKVKRGLWSPEEDEKLINYITTHGYGCCSSVPKLVGLQGCGKSCRPWINYLRLDLKRGRLTSWGTLPLFTLRSLQPRQRGERPGGLLVVLGVERGVLGGDLDRAQVRRFTERGAGEQVVAAAAKTTNPDRATFVNGRPGLLQTTAPMKLLPASLLCMTDVSQSQSLTVVSSTAKPSQNITVDHHLKDDDKKIRRTVMLIKKNVLELNVLKASFLDRFHELRAENAADAVGDNEDPHKEVKE
ncbi:hypothetical protein ACFX2J_014655 [Malus domestica]